MLGCNEQNLGNRARSRAVRLGVAMAGVALCWWLLTAELGLGKGFGWLIALPVAISSYLLISGTFGICAYYGVKGHRGSDYGSEAILDGQARTQMRHRAMLAVSASVLIAGAFAAAFVAGSS